MSVRVHIEHIAVDGWTPPHDFELTIRGRIDEQVGDGIVCVMHEHGNEFRDAIGPTIAAAFERVFLDRMQKNGAIRGANEPGQRPDFLIIDAPQNKMAAPAIGDEIADFDI